ncbi:MAG: hypothetical protein K2O24_02170 [Muribaculaceae bacterium]|nr:hypothetical protein [Muribaculaceae bacterium]
MSKTAKKASFWVRRRSHIPLLLVGGLVVALLFFNEDASVSLNMEYEHRINSLKREIKECRDSAAYYRLHREAIESGGSDLEYIAREQYRMQRPTEDVFLLSDN